MIDISITKIKDEIKNICISGHANSSKYGSDIVCASVSVLAQSAINSMIKSLDYRDDFFRIEDGFISIDIPSDVDDIQKIKIDTLSDMLLINFTDLSESYSKYIRMNVKEVGRDVKN